MSVDREEEKKRAEQERVMKIICRANTREELLVALFARSEFLRRYPGDWCILEMGESLSYLEDHFEEQDREAALAAGRDPDYVSPEQKQFTQILRNLFSQPVSLASLIADYRRAIPKIESIRFPTRQEQSEADHLVKSFQESIERLQHELTVEHFAQ